MSNAQTEFVHRALLAASIAAALTVTLLALWQFADVMLLGFAGILLAVGWRGLAETLASRSPLSTEWSVATVGVLLIVLAIAGGWWLGPDIVAGINQLFDQLPGSLKKLEQAVANYPAIEQTISEVVENTDNGSLASGLMERVSSVFSAAFGVLATALAALVGAVVILALGAYFASAPATYLDGAIRILPPRQRSRVAGVAAKAAHGLRWWLLGRLASMAVVGALTSTGLMLLGIPAALGLGVIAGLLSFIPNIGPILSALPALLIGFGESPMTALYVAGLYLAIQTVESYAITPLIQQKAVTLPPALIIFVQLLFGAAFGFLGLLLATPLALVILIAVDQLYVRKLDSELPEPT